MSMLNYQIDKLRFSAQKLHNLANGQVNQGFPARAELLDAVDAMRDAMDTIISLRSRMQELQGVGGESRYSELFGTPERAARYFAMQCFGSDGSLCYYCPFDDCDERLRNMGTYPGVYDALLAWLRGDA